MHTLWLCESWFKKRLNDIFSGKKAGMGNKGDGGGGDVCVWLSDIFPIFFHNLRTKISIISCKNF